MSIITPIAAVTAMTRDWDVVRPLMEGTAAMRAAKDALLPRHPAESPDTYVRRLAVSTLLPAYSETVNNMTDRVFAEPLQLGDDVPGELADYCADVDLQGNDLNGWAVNWFRTGLSHGLCHVLVEYPKAEGLRTKADEKQAGVRPYAVIVRPEQVLGWRTDGKRLTQVRYLEMVQEDDGDYGVTDVQQVRVLEPNIWRVYRLSGKHAWELVEEGVNSLGRIPWVTFYSHRLGMMTARPPLIELAHLNIKHWQSQSDQDNLLRVARVPLLFAFTDDDTFELTISAGTATRMPKDGDAKYVEHTGAAIEAGRQSLQDLIDEMRMAGAKLLRKDQAGTKTATQAQEDASQETSPLQRMAQHFADCIAQILQLMAEYRALGDGGHVEMRGNFDTDYAPETSIPTLVTMANTGLISKETLFTEMQRRGVISDEYNWAEELGRIEAQGPALSAL